jgi:hypothetical protein
MGIVRGILANWRERHQHPASLLLHVIGIPLIPLAIGLAVWQISNSAWSVWWLPLLLLAISYVLQGIGHRMEGNDMGELILLKKLLGKPYVAVSPRYRNSIGGE